jgi:hypothetical protein
MKRLICLSLIGILSMIALSSLISAQIEQIGIIVTDYDPSKVVPGGTLDVGFTLYKPAGIEIEGTLYTWVGFYEGDVFRWYWSSRYGALGSLENISWGVDEKQEHFTLTLKILDNLPVQTGETVRLGVGLQVGCSYDLLDVDNNGDIEQDKDNILIKVENRDFNKQITYIHEYSFGTYYYITYNSFISTHDSAFYVVSYDTAQMLEPPSNIWPTVAIVTAGVSVAIVIGIILILRRRRH